jgi:formiminoglutamase
MEGRHSGNPFSYEMNNGHLNSYSVMGLHKAYNNETILDFLDKNKCKYSFYDDLISGKGSFKDELADFVHQLKGNQPMGLELDMDAIAHSPSSAFSPSGFSSEEARYYVSTCSKELAPVYLHLPEAAPMNEQEEKISGKLLAYLTYDFMINHPRRSEQLKI